MLSHSFSVISGSFVCDKCILVSSLKKKIAALEVQTPKRVSESENSVMSVAYEIYSFKTILEGAFSSGSGSQYDC